MATYRLVSPTYTTRLARTFHIDTAFTVVKLPNSTYFNVEGFKYDDARWAGALALYLGGRDNYVDATEAAALQSAGYTIEVT